MGIAQTKVTLKTPRIHFSGIASSSFGLFGFMTKTASSFLSTNLTKCLFPSSPLQCIYNRMASLSVRVNPPKTGEIEKPARLPNSVRKSELILPSIFVPPLNKSRFFEMKSRWLKARPLSEKNDSMRAPTHANGLYCWIIFI